MSREHCTNPEAIDRRITDLFRHLASECKVTEVKILHTAILEVHDSCRTFQSLILVHSGMSYSYRATVEVRCVSVDLIVYDKMLVVVNSAGQFVLDIIKENSEVILAAFS